MRAPVYATCPAQQAVGIAHVAKETGVAVTRQEAVWLGEVEPDETAAMEKAAAEFKVLANRLMEIRR
jgi:hypothetical protein